MNPKPLCIYHHGCADGFVAAWAVRKYYSEQRFAAIRETGLDPENFDPEAVDFHPGIYGEAPPDVTGRDVILVDFSYKREQLLQMSVQAGRIRILDHHASAQDDLIDLPCNVHTHFDMARSGAMITWDHFFPGQMPPLLFDHIQDRDLWQFKLPMTREITTAIYSYSMDFDTWDILMQRPMLDFEAEGRVLTRKHRADVYALIKATRRMMWFGQVQIPVANVPYMYASDVGHEMSDGYPFAATYYDDATGRRWSLRSRPEGADVKQIAVAFGGGGHEHAAGFRMTAEQAIDFELAGGVTA